MIHLALFGNDIQTSLSPFIQQRFAEQFNLPIKYELIDCFKDGFVKKLKNFNGLGANLTSPFKRDLFFSTVIESINLTSAAENAQAINTLKINSKNKWLATNTDGVGFIKDLSDSKRFTLTNKKVLILGAGGACRGIIAEIMKGCTQVMVYNRTFAKAKKVAEEFGCEAVTEVSGQNIDLIINTTSVALNILWQEVKFDKSILKGAFYYDLKYGENAQSSLEFAKSCGAKRVVDGLGMLIEQAAESFNFWFNLKPNTKAIRSDIYQIL